MGSLYGMLTDRFGITWVVDVASPLPLLMLVRTAFGYRGFRDGYGCCIVYD